MSQSTKTVIFTDIDDTLVQTERKLMGRTSAKVGALDKLGQPLSYFTKPQQALLELLVNSGAMIIPVTGRNKAALERVVFDFEHYKVVSHGAVVLNQQGQLCPLWLSEIEQDLSHWPQQLQQADQLINKAITTLQLDARSRVIVDQDIPAYVSVKGTVDDLATLKAATQLETQQFFRHENGHNHALLPPYARKKRAIKYVVKQLQLNDDDLTIGIGDSLSDLPFMNACHFSMMPTNSQIVRESLNYDD